MSELVSELLFQIKVHGLPEPRLEYRFYKPRRWKFDLAYLEDKIAIEVEGGIYVGGRHTRPAGFENDCEKYSLAAIEGWTVIRVTSNMIKDGRAISLIALSLTDKLDRTDDNELVLQFKKKGGKDEVKRKYRKAPRFRTQRNLKQA